MTKLGFDFCDLDIWPTTLTFCMDITFVNDNNSWKFHDDGNIIKKAWRTDGQTDGLNHSYSCLVAAKNPRYILFPMDSIAPFQNGKFLWYLFKTVQYVIFLGDMITNMSASDLIKTTSTYAFPMGLTRNKFNAGAAFTGMV